MSTTPAEAQLIADAPHIPVLLDEVMAALAVQPG